MNVGRILTKALVAIARADFGVLIKGDIDDDMKAVKARKDAIVRQSNEEGTKWLKTMENLSIYEGHGRLESANTVRVNGDLLEAYRIALNVGGRGLVPDMPALDQVDYLISSSMMKVDALPDHLVIVGGGYIGLEFA